MNAIKGGGVLKLEADQFTFGRADGMAPVGSIRPHIDRAARIFNDLSSQDFYV